MEYSYESFDRVTKKEEENPPLESSLECCLC